MNFIAESDLVDALGTLNEPVPEGFIYPELGPRPIFLRDALFA